MIFQRLFISIVCLLVLTTGAMAAEKEEARFQVIENVGVLDTQTTLMWATEDNGKDINWEDAKKYCESYNAGDHTDWRQPTQKELTTLFEPGSINSKGYKITDHIKLTDCCPWASDWSMRSAGAFSFKSGRKPWGYQADSKQLRALPVRDTKPRAPRDIVPKMQHNM